MGQTIFVLNDFHIQILIAELLFCWPLPRRRGFWLRLAGGSILYILPPYLFPGGYFSPYLTVGWFTFGFFFMLLLSGVLMAFCFQLSWKRLVFNCCLAHTVQHCTHCFGNLMRLSPLTGKWMVNPAILLAMLLICGILCRRFGKDEPDLESGPLLIFACFSSMVIYCLSLWTTRLEVNTIGLNLFDMFCCIELLIIMLDAFRLRQARQEQLLVQRILHQERAQHEMAKANIEVINRKCHDLKHQISALRQMNSPEEKEQSIGELESAVLLYDRFAKTGNRDLDVVLTEKGLLCEQKQIRLECMADGEKLSFMKDPADIYSLFGNALDNAIECVSAIENPNWRVIVLNVSTRGNCLVIHMENRCPVSPDFEDGLPKTSKQDAEYHGFGMRSMRYIAEKNGGTLTARWENGLFLLDILFLLPA